jgi:indole-3-glycerol phosphate synthase
MTYLDRIIEAHRRAADADRRDVDELAEAAARQPAPRPFRAALTVDDDLSVIAEVKRRSPSKGPLAADLVPAALAKSYEAGGAACLSVLTDHDFFGGSGDDLREARGACHLPVLRKDFTVSTQDVLDARLMGADAVLLIVAALSDDELRTFRDLAVGLGMAALVEVHAEDELDRGLAAGADLVGVNQRDLATFEVDHDRAVRLAARMPDGVVRVAESGVRGAEDAVRLAGAGYHAVLVGETFVTAADPEAAVQAMTDATRSDDR